MGKKWKRILLQRRLAEQEAPAPAAAAPAVAEEAPEPVAEEVVEETPEPVVEKKTKAKKAIKRSK
ncbi:MAG: hypothetical protein VW907_00235 [Opitutae bacterium]